MGCCREFRDWDWCSCQRGMRSCLSSAAKIAWETSRGRSYGNGNTQPGRSFNRRIAPQNQGGSKSGLLFFFFVLSVSLRFGFYFFLLLVRVFFADNCTKILWLNRHVRTKKPARRRVLRHHLQGTFTFERYTLSLAGSYT